MLMCLLTFVAGALYEAACVGWVHHSERGNARATAAFSMLAAASEVSGILEAAHDLRAAPFYVLGFGFGTYCAVLFKRRMGLR